MSHASRHFQMLGSLVAQRPDQADREPTHKRIGRLLGAKGAHRLGKAYTGALNATTKQKMADLAEKVRPPMPQQFGRAQRPANSLAVVSPYKVGDVFRPKRANQHSKNITVEKCSDGHVAYQQGEKHVGVATIEEFAALIGRKVQ